MNSVNLTGRLTEDPKINDRITCASFTLAVDRMYKKENEQSADFISCKMLGDTRAGFANRYLRKGMKIAVSGRIQTGNYNGRDGKKVYTTDVIVEKTEFLEKKNTSDGSAQDNAELGNSPVNDNSGFMNIPEGIDEELPFR